MSGSERLQKAFAQYCLSKKVAVPSTFGGFKWNTFLYYKSVITSCFELPISVSGDSTGMFALALVYSLMRCRVGVVPCIIAHSTLALSPSLNISLWWILITDNIPCAIPVREILQKLEEDTDILLGNTMYVSLTQTLDFSSNVRLAQIGSFHRLIGLATEPRFKNASIRSSGCVWGMINLQFKMPSHIKFRVQTIFSKF